MTNTPDHHTPEGRFCNPWQSPSEGPRVSDFFRWEWQRRRNGVPPNPRSDSFPVKENRIAHPYCDPGEIRVTWVGHATFLLQFPGFNLLTDPIWGTRASPVSWLGPKRLVPPAVPLGDLPPIHGVVISHDHYDHLDDFTVRALQRRFGDDLSWFVPLRYERWLRRRQVERIFELDWWEKVESEGVHGPVTLRAFPIQHWTKRTPLDVQRRLWASWSMEWKGGKDGDPPRLFFAGDSGYFSGFREIGSNAGPFHASLLPIGAYEPRWMMKNSHMNPEEAVRSYLDLGGRGLFVGTHWGTFRLTDEDPMEPPVRTRKAWEQAGLPDSDLKIPVHGETFTMRISRASEGLPPAPTPSPS